MEPLETAREDDFFVGEWLVQPSLNRMRGNSGEIGIEPRAMSLLVVLKRHAGEVVTRRQLHDSVWRDAMVSDETVNRTVFDLRRVLGDEVQNPTYIETIRKVGYRLIAPVRQAPRQAESLDRTASGRQTRRRRRSVPFLILSLTLALTAAVLLGFLWSRFHTSERSSAAVPRVRQMTSYPGYETHPSVTPDGDRLAFSWDGGSQGNVDIFWRRVEEEAPVRVTFSPARDDNPEWAPDGERISFVRSGEDGCQLMLANLGRRWVSKLADCREADISTPTWTPNGDWLVFSDRDATDEPFRIQRLNPQTGEISLLTSPPFGGLGDLYPSVSPSGRRLAFVRATAKSTISTYLAPAIGDVFVLDLESETGPTRLTHDNQVISGLTWSREGEEVFFVSTREGLGYSIWRTSVTGGSPSLLLNAPGLLRHPRRVGRNRLAFERWEGKTDIWLAPLKGENQTVKGRPLQTSTRSDLNPQMSPDGSRIAFTSARTGNYEIWVSRADGSEPVQLTFFKDFAAEAPMWSPDGRELVFEVREKGGSRLHLIDSRGGPARRLTSTDSDDRSPTWSIDGRWIYFGSNRSGSWQVWRTRPDGGEVVQVTRTGGFRALESSHTSPPSLYWSKRDHGGIWESDGRGDERLVAALAPEHWGNWSIVDGPLFFVELGRRETLLQSIDLRNGRTRTAGRIEDWISRETPNLSLSPDGAIALLTRFTGLASDLLVVEYAAAPWTE